ncbi:hypothetical protein J4Z08_21270 [Citrobacter portucalensis]|uniref:hypothetical protein n=1 Tax=Citrobacter portucalensis TaxID=1639133 RepID=UPI0031407C09
MFFLNDSTANTTILSCRNQTEAAIYKNWAQEHNDGKILSIDLTSLQNMATGEELLRYFGFTIDELIRHLFVLLPARSRSLENRKLLFSMLLYPTLSKKQCCDMSQKNHEHYSRFSKTLSSQCASIALLSGGRNPLKLMRGIRGDL